MMNYDGLMNFIRTNFTLVHHHGYDLTALENMMSWERLIYIDLLKQHLKEEEEKYKQQLAERRAQGRVRR